MLKSRYEMIQSKRRKPHRKESIHKKEEEKVGKEWATTLQFFWGMREKMKKVGKRRLGFFYPNTKLILVLMVIFKGSNNNKWV